MTNLNVNTIFHLISIHESLLIIEFKIKIIFYLTLKKKSTVLKDSNLTIYNYTINMYIF